MYSSRNLTKRLRNVSSPNDHRDESQVLRGTPPAWLTRWQLASRLRDRLEMIYGDSNHGYALRLTRVSRSYRDLIQRYSNDSML